MTLPWLKQILSAAAATLLHAFSAQAQEVPWHDPSPHQVRMVTVAPDVALEVLDWGGIGPALVFLPGLGNTAHVFDDFAPRFRDAYHVFGITPRGFGDSSRPDSGYDSAARAGDIVAVLDTLAIPSAILAGHSIAGDELSRMGADYSRRVRALVYLDAYSYGKDAYHPAGALPPEPQTPLTAADSASPAALAAWVLRVRGVRESEGEIHAQATFSPTGRLLRAGRANAAGRVIAGTEASDYAHILAPALAIYARAQPAAMFPGYPRMNPEQRQQADTVVASLRRWQDAQIRRFRAELRRGTVVEIEGANHYVFASNPDEVEQAMRRFLEPARP